VKAAIGLGCSLGPRRATLERTVHQLHATPHTRVLRVSRWWRTPPMRGGTARGWFLNGVVLVETELSPDALLDRCIALERRAGRRRARHWGDRTLDLDLLHVEGVTSDGPRLVLPHPGIGRRPFVRLPLREVWPEAVDPRSGATWLDLSELAGPRPVPAGAMSWPRWTAGPHTDS
jgi:2-amino-4-hydroxy-6-hydroxymethyldihydropteridine diphosphokinase